MKVCVDFVTFCLNRALLDSQQGYLWDYLSLGWVLMLFFLERTTSGIEPQSIQGWKSVLVTASEVATLWGANRVLRLDWSAIDLEGWGVEPFWVFVSFGVSSLRFYSSFTLPATPSLCSPYGFLSVSRSVESRAREPCSLLPHSLFGLGWIGHHYMLTIKITPFMPLILVWNHALPLLSYPLLALFCHCYPVPVTWIPSDMRPWPPEN